MNALVKRATLRMQLGAPEESLHDLLMAAELGPDNADVFHHRGQVLYLLGVCHHGTKLLFNIKSQQNDYN